VIDVSATDLRLTAFQLVLGGITVFTALLYSRTVYSY